MVVPRPDELVLVCTNERVPTPPNTTNRYNIFSRTTCVRIRNAMTPNHTNIQIVGTTNLESVPRTGEQVRRILTVPPFHLVWLMPISGGVVPLVKPSVEKLEPGAVSVAMAAGTCEGIPVCWHRAFCHVSGVGATRLRGLMLEVTTAVVYHPSLRTDGNAQFRSQTIAYLATKGDFLRSLTS